MLMSGLPTLLSRALTVVSAIDFPSGRVPPARHITFQRGGVHRHRQPQSPPEGAPSQGLCETGRIGVEMRASARQSARRVRDQPIPRSVGVELGDDTQQLGGRRTRTATHTRADDICATDHWKYYP
ncbi:hypothetical protein GCM10023223_14880 [Stackebrandtia albiflava]